MNKYTDFSKMTSQELKYEISIQKDIIAGAKCQISDANETIQAIKEAIEINKKHSRLFFDHKLKITPLNISDL